jgi:FAD/FMN-containing dehydrogenase
LNDTATSRAIGEATEQELREAVRGAVLGPRDAGYDDARRIWNATFDDRRPAFVVRCTGVADVVAAIEFARGRDLPLAVRGGGHSVAGFSTCDGGVVVDLSPLRNVRIDPEPRRAVVGGGATWGEVDRESQAFGLATTGGMISTTGVAGFTLGGGIGWLMRKHGLACDNLLAADVVTADGKLLRASAHEHPELFWGLRGGGGNFGVVTTFELELHPVGPLVYAGPIFFPAEAAADLLRAFREWAPLAPDDVTALVILTTAPPIPAVPADWHGRKVAVSIAVSVGSVDEGDEHVRGLREVAQPVADLLGPMPYGVIQSLVDPLWPKGIHSYFKAANLARLDDELIESLCRLHREAPGSQCEIHVHQMGGKVARVREADTAFAERSMPYVLNAVAGWHEPAASVEHVAWARSVIAAATDASTGRAYVNFLGDADAASSSYSRDTYRRLVDLKNAYDPTNVFRLNQNIQPQRRDR